jgi:hypothetical protein
MKQLGGRQLPSIIRNEHVKILNGSNKYVEMPIDFHIIFDSGNQAQTMVGKTVIETLGLVPHQICVKEIHGVSGSDFCYQGVNLHMKLVYPYNTPNDHKDAPDHELVVEAMVSNDKNMGKTILFGHDGGLNQLFSAGYMIDSLYHDDHQEYLLQFVLRQAVNPETKEGADLGQFLILFHELFPALNRLNDTTKLSAYFHDQHTAYLLMNVLEYYLQNSGMLARSDVIRNHRERSHIIETMTELYLMLRHNKSLVNAISGGLLPFDRMKLPNLLSSNLPIAKNYQTFISYAEKLDASALFEIVGETKSLAMFCGMMRYYADHERMLSNPYVVINTQMRQHIKNVFETIFKGLISAEDPYSEIMAMVMSLDDRSYKFLTIALETYTIYHR